MEGEVSPINVEVHKPRMGDLVIVDYFNDYGEKRLSRKDLCFVSGLKMNSLALDNLASIYTDKKHPVDLNEGSEVCKTAVFSESWGENVIIRRHKASPFDLSIFANAINKATGVKIGDKIITESGGEALRMWEEKIDKLKLLPLVGKTAILEACADIKLPPRSGMLMKEEVFWWQKEGDSEEYGWKPISEGLLFFNRFNKDKSLVPIRLARIDFNESGNVVETDPKEPLREKPVVGLNVNGQYKEKRKLELATDSDLKEFVDNVLNEFRRRSGVVNINDYQRPKEMAISWINRKLDIEGLLQNEKERLLLIFSAARKK